MIVDGDWLSST